MNKVVMLSAVSLLSLAGIAVSQAAETASTAASTATATASTAQAASSAASTAAAKKPDIPQDPPQVQKLVALYPNLIARIAPQGKVCFEGQDCDISITVALGAADEANPRDGKTIYEGVCHTCHATGLLGSPKFGDKGMWGPRIAKGKPTLYDHALHGFNSMPAKGGNADLLDVEVKNAVDYMVQQGS